MNEKEKLTTSRKIYPWPGWCATALASAQISRRHPLLRRLLGRPSRRALQRLLALLAEPSHVLGHLGLGLRLSLSLGRLGAFERGVTLLAKPGDVLRHEASQGLSQAPPAPSPSRREGAQRPPPGRPEAVGETHRRQVAPTAPGIVLRERAVRRLAPFGAAGADALQGRRARHLRFRCARWGRSGHRQHRGRELAHHLGRERAGLRMVLHTIRLCQTADRESG